MKKSPPRVLVVDDEEQIRESLSELLASEGFNVAVAADGWGALEQLEAAEFDIVVADVRLPEGLDGLETVKYARARQPDLKSLFISGLGGPVWDDPRRDDFVSKPFKPRELLGCVLELLKRELPAPRPADARRLAEQGALEAKVGSMRRKRERAARCG